MYLERVGPTPESRPLKPIRRPLRRPIRKASQSVYWWKDKKNGKSLRRRSDFCRDVCGVPLSLQLVGGECASFDRGICSCGLACHVHVNALFSFVFINIYTKEEYVEAISGWSVLPLILQSYKYMSMKRGGGCVFWNSTISLLVHCGEDIWVLECEA